MDAEPGSAGLRTGAKEENANTERGCLDPAASNPVHQKHAGTEPGAPKPGAPRGWHSRGYMPHFDSNDVVQHVTFHLADSLPQEVVERIQRELQQQDPEEREIERRAMLEDYLDAGHGACWLRRDNCAHIVQSALMHFDGQRYRLIDWVVMPNHVHVTFQSINEWSMGEVIGSWKTFTANQIGRVVRQPGSPIPKVWYREYWDRYIRDERHFANVAAYITNNPVKAGLVNRPEQWGWSSAAWKVILGSAGLRTGAKEVNASAARGCLGSAASDPGHSEHAGTEPGAPRRNCP